MSCVTEVFLADPDDMTAEVVRMVDQLRRRRGDAVLTTIVAVASGQLCGLCGLCGQDQATALLSHVARAFEPGGRPCPAPVYRRLGGGGGVVGVRLGWRVRWRWRWRNCVWRGPQWQAGRACSRAG